MSTHPSDSFATSTMKKPSFKSDVSLFIDILHQRNVLHIKGIEISNRRIQTIFNNMAKYSLTIE